MNLETILAMQTAAAEAAREAVYRILMRLATVLVAIPLFGLVLAIAMTPGPIHLHTDAVGLTVVFGPAALMAALAWIFKPRV